MLLQLVATTVAIALLTLPAARGSIRCYCNNPQCAADSGYICESESNRCFSKLYSAYHAAASHPSKPPPDEHGCSDLLPKPQRGICDGSGEFIKQTERGDAIIMCCGEALCNYNQNQDIGVDISRTAGNSSKERQTSRAVEHARPGSHDAWFTAAIVCVPIVGGLILVVLVLVAVRMLQNDHKRSHRQKPAAMAHAKLRLADHFPWRQGKREARMGGQQNSDMYRDVTVQVGHWLSGVSICSLRGDSSVEEISSSVLVWNDQSAFEKTSVQGAAIV